MKMIGVDDQYADAGPYEELLAHLGLQGEQIAATVEQFLNMN
jgi:transketolase C-terminal domain/subunit